MIASGMTNPNQAKAPSAIAGAAAGPGAVITPPDAAAVMGALGEYMTDAWQRTILQLQEQAANAIVTAWNGYRDRRDQMEEQTFYAIYVLGTGAGLTPPRRPPAKTPEEQEEIAAKLAEYRAKIATGGPLEAFARALLYVLEANRKFDERMSFALHKIAPKFNDIPMERQKEIVRDQFFALQLDPDQALRTLPVMVPKSEERETLVRDLVEALDAAGAPTPETERRITTLSDLLGVRPIAAKPAAIAGPRPKITALKSEPEKVKSGAKQ